MTAFQIDFDFVEHELRAIDSRAGSFTLALEPKPVARFYRELMDGLHGLGIDVRIRTTPAEVVDAIPFERDERHADYDPGHATRCGAVCSRRTAS